MKKATKDGVCGGHAVEDWRGFEFVFGESAAA
jgi:hypothetical protein